MVFVECVGKERTSDFSFELEFVQNIDGIAFSVYLTPADEEDQNEAEDEYDIAMWHYELYVCPFPVNIYEEDYPNEDDVLVAEGDMELDWATLHPDTIGEELYALIPEDTRQQITERYSEFMKNDC